MRIQNASENPKGPAGKAGVFQVGLLTIAILTAVLVPLRILGHGFLPDDDALRHAAKVLSGKSWQEILVMRPEITIDHNPGWHWLLGVVHQATGWDAPMLVAFSVVAMCALFVLSPLPWLKRPEAWLVTLAVLFIIFPYFGERGVLGRPLLLTAAVTVAILGIWSGPRERSMSDRWKIGPTVVLFALSAWVHGSWYLLVLIPGAFFLARRWRAALLLGVCWVAGTLAGAMFTGQPWTFLRQSAMIPFLALGKTGPPEALVTELQPFSGGYPALFVFGAVLLGLKFRGKPLADVTRDPVFWLALGGWLLGFRVVRFWLDFGLPALAFWTARHIQGWIAARVPPDGVWRFGLGGAASLALLFVTASDHGNRWSRVGEWEPLQEGRPEHEGCLPDPGGILYNVDLSVFYQTFFANPRGDWRYALGFEPSFMTDENLAVYHELHRTRNAIKACEPWVAKMTPADRLVLRAPPGVRPSMPPLEWRYAAANTWVGRLPR